MIISHTEQPQVGLTHFLNNALKLFKVRAPFLIMACHAMFKKWPSGLSYDKKTRPTVFVYRKKLGKNKWLNHIFYNGCNY